MKLLGIIIAVATASTAISHDERKLCYCCLDLVQWFCCTAWLWPDTSPDAQSMVAETLTAIQVIILKSKLII